MTAIEFNHQLVNLEGNLSRFAISLTSNIDDAKDLVQDTMLKAITYRTQYADYTNLKAWTYTIMKNTFINNYRKNVRQKTVLDDTKDLYYLNQNKDTFSIAPDSAFTEKEISKEIEKLDDAYKIPFRMHIEGYKYKEIAEKLNLRIGTVKSRIFFTRKKLMNELQDIAYSE